MAKYRRYRKYTRRGRGRWSSNIQEIGNNINVNSSTWRYTQSLLSNPSQVTSFVSQKFTVKNIECSFTIDTSSATGSAAIEGVTAYIMFVPEGFALNATNLPEDFNIKHPEYIMAYKYLGSPNYEAASGGSQQQYQPYKIRTRLARKMDTGDQIVLFIKGINQDNVNAFVLRLDGVVRWWTKAN